MGWSPYQYYTSSPCEFYYACKGYFDKEENQMLIMRKVAQAASAGFVKSNEFEKFWPSPYSAEKTTIDFTSEEYKEWYRKMKVKHNIK